MGEAGIAWLSHFCQIAWQSRKTPLDWQIGVVIRLFKRGDQRVCFNYRGITVLSLHEKVYAKVPERRCRELIEPKIQEKQSAFRGGGS
jgi:hypothetical protein